MPRKKSEDYVNNKEFSQAVYDYVLACRAAKSEDKEDPQIPAYIGECFVKIASGLSKKGNFNGYTYKEEMVADAIENMVQRVGNFNIDAETRSGLPNAFSYFTTMCYYAFVRRIQKEKRQQNIKDRFRDQSGAADFADCSSMDGSMSEGMVEKMKNKMDFFKEEFSTEQDIKEVDEHLFDEDDDSVNQCAKVNE